MNNLKTFKDLTLTDNLHIIKGNELEIKHFKAIEKTNDGIVFKILDTDEKFIIKNEELERTTLNKGNYLIISDSFLAQSIITFQNSLYINLEPYVG